MRKIIKRIIESVNIYNEVMWGDGGYYDSLAGETFGFHSYEIENKANKAWNDLKSIYGNKKGIPHNNTLLRHGITNDNIEIIEKVKKEIGGM